MLVGGGGVSDGGTGVCDGTSVVGGASVVGAGSVKVGVGVSSLMTMKVAEGVAELSGVLVGTLGTLMTLPAWMKVDRKSVV